MKLRLTRGDRACSIARAADAELEALRRRPVGSGFRLWRARNDSAGLVCERGLSAPGSGGVVAVGGVVDGLLHALAQLSNAEYPTEYRADIEANIAQWRPEIWARAEEAV